MTDRDSIDNEPDCDERIAGECLDGDRCHMCVAPEGHTDWHVCPCGVTWP